MKEIKVEDFEVVKDEYGYDFTTYFDFWEDEVGVTLDLDYNIKDEKELSEEEIREVIEKALKKSESSIEKS